MGIFLEEVSMGKSLLETCTVRFLRKALLAAKSRLNHPGMVGYNKVVVVSNGIPDTVEPVLEDPVLGLMVELLGLGEVEPFFLPLGVGSSSPSA